MNGNANSPGLVRDGARDGLPDPPRRIRGKLVAAPVFELIGRAHQSDVALLDEVQQVKSAIHVLLDLPVQLAQLLDGALDLLREFLPFKRAKGDSSNPLRYLHLRPVQSIAPALALPLHVDRHRLHFVGDLL